VALPVSFIVPNWHHLKVSIRSKTRSFAATISLSDVFMVPCIYRFSNG
jgi:hypothetical protein